MSDGVMADILGLTARIVGAHLSRNSIAAEAVPALIEGVYRSLSSLGAVAAPATTLTPAVPIRKSVFADYLVCLEDGKQLKMLKRHLQASYGMTPDEYRTKWGLPATYPMVAPNYASHRSALAKKIGLGRKPADAGPEVTDEPASEGELKAEKAEPTVKLVKARRARGSRG